MDETLQYCQGCLSTDRILYSLKQLQSVIDRIRLNEMKAMNGGVCWECRSMMIRFSHFQLQVLKAQKILECREMLPDAKSFSRLTYKNNCIFNYKFYHKSDPLIDTKDKPEVKIKEEVISDDNCETETEIKYDDETIDDEYDNLIENDEKPKTNDVYVDILATKTKIRKGKVQKKFSTKLKDVNEEELKKFRTIVFTEEEMLRNREEKRNQPNFKKIPFKCDFCVLGFTRKDTYNMHMEKKHDENVGDHACPVCQTRFPNEKLVERHKKKHYVCYRCLLCKYETLELWSAVSHCRIKHDADSSERIHCPYCDTVAKCPEPRHSNSIVCGVH